MPVKTVMVGVVGLGMLSLSACGGSGSSPVTQPGAVDTTQSDHSAPQDTVAVGPVELAGATPGGNVTVLTLNGLSTTLDPSEVYYTDTSSIMSGLVTRSLLQYRYDPKTKQMILVPDLSEDLGQHNDDYTRWKFTIRDGATWENGDPVTAREIKWGIQRCMDAATFPTGPCQYYANVYFKGGSSYKGPYTAPNQKFTSVKVNGNVLTIDMDKPFPDMPYWGSFPAMGPMPLGAASDPKSYKKHPLSTGPYLISRFSPSKELVLTRNPHWDPASDPARTQYPDGYDFKMQTQSEKIDQILLADTGTGQTTLTYDDLLSPDFTKMKSQSPERLTLGGSPCTYYWAPDNRKITSKLVREALSWAYPYKNVILASGLIPNVNAIPGNNLMPPGLPGRTPYNVTGRKDFQTDPAKAKQLLKQANATGYEIKFLFRTDDSVNVQVKDTIVKALQEAGFKATPVPTTIADYVAARDNTTEDINVRSAGWCSDWPSGATWIPTVYGSTDPDRTRSFGTNYAAFGDRSVDAQISSISKLPLDLQAVAWAQLDQTVAKKHFPLFPTYYTGIAAAHGSKINGDFDDDTLGMPTWKNIWVTQQ